jgi:Ca2+-binding EF-hand superfamily protein
MQIIARRRYGAVGRVLLLIAGVCAMMLLLMQAGQAYSDRETVEIFKLLDENGDGQVTRDEYEISKVEILYRRVSSNPIDGVTYSQTKVTRRFFDSADTDHDGKLSPHEAIDALAFSSVAGSKDYFDIEDLRRFLRSISR